MNKTPPVKLRGTMPAETAAALPGLLVLHFGDEIKRRLQARAQRQQQKVTKR